MPIYGKLLAAASYTAAMRDDRDSADSAWVPPRPGRTEGVMFVYDGGTFDEVGTADIQLPPDELSSWAWCTDEQIRERMSELLARRVVAALRAKAEGTMFDLENGFHTH